MGHGASSPKSALNPLFISNELAQGSKYLAEDENFRGAFINYIKSGLWIERLATFVKEDMFTVESRQVDTISDGVSFSFREYSSTKTSAELDRSTKEWSSSKRTQSSVSASPISSLKKPLPRSEFFRENYVNIEDFRCFSSSQLISILANVLYPMFITHFEPDERSSFGQESLSSELMDAVGLKQPKRVQEVFLGMAAYFDESTLHLELQNPAWVGLVPDTFDSYPLSITISDTSQEGCPIVYANRAFHTLTGLTAAQVTGNNFDILNGPNTEVTQVRLLDQALKFQRASKVALTHYTAGSKKEFPNFIALKPSGKFMIGVHFVPTRSAQIDDIQLVDDVLMVLAYVLKYPRANRGEIRTDIPLPRGISVDSAQFLKELHLPAGPAAVSATPRNTLCHSQSVTTNSLSLSMTNYSMSQSISQSISRSRSHVGLRASMCERDDEGDFSSSFHLSPLEVSELSRPGSAAKV